MNSVFNRSVCLHFLLVAASVTMISCGVRTDNSQSTLNQINSGGSTASFTISSTAFGPSAANPAIFVVGTKYAAVDQQGQNTSPGITISGLPADASKLAIIMDDESCSPACVHWNVFNLPATKISIAENEDLTKVSTTVVLGAAYNLQTGYQGPNPPSQHTYKLAVYALSSTAVNVQATPVPSYTRAQFEAAYAGKILGTAVLTGRFPGA